jgi:hypothetical protein
MLVAGDIPTFLSGNNGSLAGEILTSAMIGHAKTPKVLPLMIYFTTTSIIIVCPPLPT